MSKNPTVVLISDYGTGDAAFTEVMLQLRTLVPEAMIIPQSTPPFSTVNTGFWIYQIALTTNLHDCYIFSNTAPRKEDKSAQKNNRGEKLMYAKLKNGFEIMAINSGYTFSFVKPYIQEFRFVNVENEGSQFRSRDKYPQSVAKMIQHDSQVLGEQEDKHTIPEAPTHTIAAIDGYGNIKTTMRQSEMKLEPGSRVIINIHNRKHLATYTAGIFHVADGELTFSPGSSGHNDKFIEIVLRGGSAYRLFDKPQVEETFAVTPLNA